MDSTMGLMDLIVVIAGLYMLYGYYLLMTKNEIKEGIMISKASSGKKCKDIEGFKREMGPRVLIFAIIAIVDGVLGLIGDFVVPIPGPLFWAFYALFFAALVWFMAAARKIERKYF